MAEISKIVTDVIHDDVDGVYRAVVEYYDSDLSTVATIPVEFTGEKNVAYGDIEKFAFERAAEIAKALP